MKEIEEITALERRNYLVRFCQSRQNILSFYVMQIQTVREGRNRVEESSLELQPTGKLCEDLAE